MPRSNLSTFKRVVRHRLRAHHGWTQTDTYNYVASNPEYLRGLHESGNTPYDAARKIDTARKVKRVAGN